MSALIPTSSAADTQELQLSTPEVISYAKLSLDFLAALAAPTVFQYLFPPVLKSAWEWLTQNASLHREFPQLALGIPRGFAKTFLIKLFVLYCILFTSKKFILIFASNEDKAINILSDICSMLNEINVRKTFGDWRMSLEVDQQSKKKFHFRGRAIVIKAMGIGGDPRGINENNSRPDLMIFDDVQTREDSESLDISNRLEAKLVGTIMKAKSPEGCMFLFLANMYPTKGSLLRRFKSNSNWVKFICGGILADGTSLWEELHPIKQLLREYENDKAAGRADIFYAEVLNDETAQANNIINLSELPPTPFRPGDPSAGSFIIIDPSNDKANSDAVSIGLFEIHDTIPYLSQLVEGRLSPGETIHAALKMALASGTSIIAVESNAYQYSLLYWFGVVTQQMGIMGIQAVEVYSGNMSKNSRILKMFAALKAGEIFYAPSTAPAVNSQITQFNPLRRDNTDGILDLLTYAPKVIEIYGQAIISSMILESQEVNSIPILMAGENCSF
jgi:hypothetical protein